LTPEKVGYVYIFEFVTPVIFIITNVIPRKKLFFCTLPAVKDKVSHA
jgi:hypothetical protein